MQQRYPNETKHDILRRVLSASDSGGNNNNNNINNDVLPLRMLAAGSNSPPLSTRRSLGQQNRLFQWYHNRFNRQEQQLSPNQNQNQLRQHQEHKQGSSLTHS